MQHIAAATRAMSATSDRHATQLAFVHVSVLIADYALPVAGRSVTVERRRATGYVLGDLPGHARHGGEECDCRKASPPFADSGLAAVAGGPGRSSPLNPARGGPFCGRPSFHSRARRSALFARRWSTALSVGRGWSWSTAVEA
jgi:hypothetical protein